VRKDVASIVISLNSPQNFHSTSTTLLPKSTVENTTSANLAWACFSCNLRKGPNIAGIDPESGVLTRLYHSRTDQWTDHFEWHGVTLLGKTAVGRTTVEVLAINDADSVAVREALRDEGIFES
jgi:hypothetical protein